MDTCSVFSLSVFIMNQVEEFAKFLHQKGVSDHVVGVAKEQRLTMGVIKYMTEKDLEDYFPSLGDQLQLRPILNMLKVSLVINCTTTNFVTYWLSNMTNH